ncbi:HXXEE domain-containing protein [Pseudonocardia sp. CA-107938]|uniref:HXXEE domain-containing protein n=1 Tax=Pseudonocardia sp. CA-107938 TaxID=3240021 RepID=UPI003D8AB81A
MTRRLPRSVTWGLFAAWVLHDAEELVTIPRWIERARPRLRRRFPSVPDAAWDRLAPDQTHTAVAIALMGGLVAAAAAAGERTEGRSPFFQAALLGFGAHAVVPHLAGAAVTGGYTPGLGTAPTVVLPFTWWARRQLRKAGVEPAPLPASALLLVPLSIGGAQGAASLIVRLARSVRRYSGVAKT